VKRRVSTFLSVRLFNPLVKAAARAELPLFGVAILETTGRRSGQPRRTPVGPAVDGDVVWIVAEHGRRAAYVRNIEADPRVRIRLGRRWRCGVASVVPDDDPRARRRSMPWLNGLVVRAMGSELLTVRIDLANENRREGAA
jgi:deazaflavin-dependent oxidoreductase (nitroreductase family)